MDAFAVEQQGVAGTQGVLGVAVAVDHDAFEHVQQFGARVLEAWEDLAGIGQGDQDRFESLVLATQRTE